MCSGQDSENWVHQACMQDSEICYKCRTAYTAPLDNNDLVACDYCANWVHQICHVPRLESVPKVEFKCSVCVETQEKRKEKTDAARLIGTASFSAAFSCRAISRQIHGSAGVTTRSGRVPQVVETNNPDLRQLVRRQELILCACVPSCFFWETNNPDLRQLLSPPMSAEHIDRTRHRYNMRGAELKAIMNVMDLPGAVLDRILGFWWEDANQSHELQAVCTRLNMTRFTNTQLCKYCVEVGRKVRLHVGSVKSACKALGAWCHEGRRTVMWMMLKHVRKSHTNLTTLCLQNSEMSIELIEKMSCPKFQSQ